MAIEDNEITPGEGEPESVVQLPSSNGDNSVISELKQKRAEKTPFGKVKILEVAGYEGKLAVQYRYITSEVTEAIGKKIAKQTRNVKGRRGVTLLAALDTLAAACDYLVIRDSTDEEWRPMPPGLVVFDTSERPESTPVGQVLEYDSRNPRMAVLGLYGEEHGVINTYMVLSRWLTDTTRSEDEDFLDL